MPWAYKYTVSLMSDVDAVTPSTPIPPAAEVAAPDEPAPAATDDDQEATPEAAMPAPAGAFDDTSGGNVDLFA